MSRERSPGDPFPDRARLTSNLNLVELPPAAIQRALRGARADSWDAIVVPCVRGAEALDDVLSVARRTGAVLVLLCSDPMSAEDVAARFGKDAEDVPWVALDIGPEKRPAWGMIPFSHPIAVDQHENDVSAKRNTGLALARLMGWRNVLFMDDDIKDAEGLEPNLDLALRLLCGRDRKGVPRDATGFTFRHHRDDSVIGHACHFVGSAHEPFLGGGVLAVRCEGDVPAFPPVYNEDWLFLSVLLGRRPDSVALVGEAFQYPDDLDPTAGEARRQEPGEVLAEALFAHLQAGASGGAFDLDPAEPAFWTRHLAVRREILGIAARRLASSRVLTPLRWGFLDAVRAARSVHSTGTVTSETLAGFYQQWRMGELAWWQYLDRLAAVDVSDDHALDAAFTGMGLPVSGADAGSVSLRERLITSRARTRTGPVPLGRPARSRRKKAATEPRPAASGSG